MKTLFATAATAALVISASQVSAQTAAERRNDPFAAFAQSPLPPRAGQQGLRSGPSARRHSTNPAHDVYDTQGNYIGSDPDPFIRNDLMRVPPLRGED